MKSLHELDVDDVLLDPVNDVNGREVGGVTKNELLVTLGNDAFQIDEVLTLPETLE